MPSIAELKRHQGNVENYRDHVYLLEKGTKRFGLYVVCLWDKAKGEWYRPDTAMTCRRPFSSVTCRPDLTTPLLADNYSDLGEAERVAEETAKSEYIGCLEPRARPYRFVCEAALKNARHKLAKLEMALANLEDMFE